MNRPPLESFLSAPQAAPQRPPLDSFFAPTTPQGSPEANSIADYAMAVPTGITKGLMGLVSAPRELNDLAAKGVDWATGTPGHASLAKDIGLPSYQDVKGGFEKAVTGVGNALPGAKGQAVLPNAQGAIPKMIETGASFATPIPGAGAISLPSTAARFVGGVASEGAGQATEGTALEPYARVGAGIGGALLAGKGINGFQKGFAGTAERVAPTTSEVKDAAQASYKTAEAAGGTLSPKVTNTFIANASKTLAPQTEAGKAVLGESPSTQLSQRLTQLVDRPLSLQSAQEIDEGLGSLIDKEYGLKGLTKEGQKILTLQQNFRDAIKNAGEGDIVGGTQGFDAWKQGQKLWSQQRKMSDIERIVENANMTDNPATAIKTGAKNLLKSKAIRGYSDDEIAAVKDMSSRGAVGGTLHVFGSRLIPLLTTGVGGAGGGIPGALAGAAIGQGASTAMRAGATALQNSSAANAIETIARGQAVPGMAEKAGMGLRDLFGKTGGTTPPPMSPGVAQGIGAVSGAPASMQQNMAPQATAQPLITRKPGAQQGAMSSNAVMGTALGAATAGVASKAINTYLQRTKQAESGGINNAQSPTSSAFGPFQFTRGTWQKMIDKYAPPEIKARPDVQSLRSDPGLSEFMAGKLAEENAQSLAKKEVPVNDGSLYVAHFAGGQRAARMYIANPKAPATKFFAPFEIEANPTILKGKSIGQVIKKLESKMNG